jgi:hypothetical protein
MRNLQFGPWPGIAILLNGVWETANREISGPRIR